MNLYRINTQTYNNSGPNIVTTKYIYYVSAKNVKDCILKLQQNCPEIEIKEDIIKIEKIGEESNNNIFENIKL